MCIVSYMYTPNRVNRFDRDYACYRTSMSLALGDIPSEIFAYILQFLDPTELQSTTCCLAQAFPGSTIPKDHIFHFVRIVHPAQLVRLFLRLRQPDKPAKWIKEMSIETWQIDADIAIGVIRQLSSLQSLKLRIGPNNFTPEHLQELLEMKAGHNIWTQLEHLEIRFRP